MTLSMSRLASDPASVTLAGNAILIVVAVNTVAKAVIGWATGGAAYGKPMMVAAAVALGLGAVGLVAGPTFR